MICDPHASLAFASRITPDNEFDAEAVETSGVNRLVVLPHGADLCSVNLRQPFAPLRKKSHSRAVILQTANRNSRSDLKIVSKSREVAEGDVFGNRELVIEFAAHHESIFRRQFAPDCSAFQRVRVNDATELNGDSLTDRDFLTE